MTSKAPETDERPPVPRGDNPQGLATFDPMENPKYRKLVREISDRFRRSKGLPPIPRQPGEDEG